MTVEEIKLRLDTRGIEYDAKANKPELEVLLFESEPTPTDEVVSNQLAEGVLGQTDPKPELEVGSTRIIEANGKKYKKTFDANGSSISIEEITEEIE